MAEENGSNGVCKAHSGIEWRLKVGAAIISALMIIFMALLGGMWASLGSSQEKLMQKIDCLAPATTVNELTGRVNFIREKQIEIDNRTMQLERRLNRGGRE